MDLDYIEESLISSTPPWCLPVPEVLLDLASYKKGEVAAALFQQCLNQIFQDFQGFRRIFTDGSKSEDGRVAAAAVLQQNPPSTFQYRLIDGSSIYSAELQAILLALRHVYQSKDYNFLVISDSLSALQALQTID